MSILTGVIAPVKQVVALSKLQFDIVRVNDQHIVVTCAFKRRPVAFMGAPAMAGSPRGCAIALCATSGSGCGLHIYVAELMERRVRTYWLIPTI